MQEPSKKKLTSLAEEPSAMDTDKIENSASADRLAVAEPAVAEAALAEGKTAGKSAAVVEDKTVADLTQELAKWQERVPKLAAALRERTQQADQLQVELDASDSNHRQLQKQLHNRDAAICELQEDVGAWKDRLQALTSPVGEQEPSAGSSEDDLQRMNDDVGPAVDGGRAADVGAGKTAPEAGEIAPEAGEIAAEVAEIAAEVAELNTEVTDLNTEVTDLNTALQASTRTVEDRDHELATLTDEKESLNDRNAKLFETTELANRQIETLGDNLADLRDQLRNKADMLRSVSDEVRSLQKNVAARDEQIAKLTQNCEGQQNAAESLEKRVAEERAEVSRLEECVDNADRVTSEREAERRQLSEQLAELTERNQHLESQLDERSKLVVGLEQEHASKNDETLRLGTENEQLLEALAKTERHASEQTTHINHLDSLIERQKEHMLELDAELVETQEECNAARKDGTKAAVTKDKQIFELKEELGVANQRVEESEANGADHDELMAKIAGLEASAAVRVDVEAQTAAVVRELEDKLAQSKDEFGAPTADDHAVQLLQEEVHKLEQMVRDRTELLNKMQWQQDMTEQPEAHGMDSDNKLLIVLNQQLSESRESNNRLVAHVRELKAQLANRIAADDLTVIKGIGPKVAVQLAELGVATFVQIAEIDEADLADEAHLLHAFKNRIEKDAWVLQARELLHG